MASESGGAATITRDKPIDIARMFYYSGVEYKGVALPMTCTPSHMKAIETMEIREDDVLMTSYPKSGTHWMMEYIIWILNGGKRPAMDTRVVRMSRLLEMPNPATGGDEKERWDAAPRLLVTHLPIQFLPSQIWEKKPKIVYLSRDPRDTLTALYSFLRRNPVDPPSFNFLFDLFCSQKASYGTCWDHVHGFWEHRNDDNFLYIHFADMKKNPAGCVARVAAHLGHDLSFKQMREVVKYTSMAEMKATYAQIEEELGPLGKTLTHAAGIIPFLHKGEVGRWKDLFKVAQSEQFQKYHEEQLKKYGDGFNF